MIRLAEAFPDEVMVSALRRRLIWAHLGKLEKSGIRVASYWTEVPAPEPAGAEAA